MKRNLMAFDGGYQAVIDYDPETEMFYGEFIGLNGSADFWGKNVKELKKEGKISLADFFAACAQRGIEPVKKGNPSSFALRLDPELYRAVASAAAAEGVSMNQFLADAIKREVRIYN